MPWKRRSSISPFSSASIWFGDRSRTFSRSFLSWAVSGRFSHIEFHLSEEIPKIGMSVSGYILAPPGSGRNAVVVPSSGLPFLITTFLTS